MFVRVFAWLSPLFGVYRFLAASVWGLAVGAVAGVLALLSGWAVLTEHPLGWTRRAARGGIVTGGLALVVWAAWVVLAVVGV